MIVIGDLHSRDDKKPFHLVTEEMFKILYKTLRDVEVKDTLLFLGDITDKSMISGELTSLIYKFFKDLSEDSWKEIIIILGNHEYTWNTELKCNSYSIDFLKEIPKIKIISKETVMKTIGDLDILCLPYQKRNMIEGKSLKEYYENLPKEISDHNFDFIFGHVADQTNTLFGHYCDLAYLKGDIVLGHVHKKNGNSLGSIYSCNYGERNKESFILEINSNTKEKNYIKLPNLVNYYTLKYGDDINSIETDSIFCIYDITNAPNSNKEDVLLKYPGINIREVYCKNFNSLVEQQEQVDIDSLSIDNLFDKCLKETNYEATTNQYIEDIWKAS